MVLVKNWTFFHVFIFVKIRQENVFEDILGRKKSFFRLKIRKLKKSKSRDFPKRIVHGFDKKFAIFPSFYFWQNQKGKCV